MVLTSEIPKLKVPELKRELKQRGLSTTGNKNELIERLQYALKSPAVSSELSSTSLESFMLEEELLNDDDDEHPNSSESVLNCEDVENVLEETSVHSENDKDNNVLKRETSNGIEKKTRKIKLQRDFPLVDSHISSNKSDNGDENCSSESSEPKSKIIKLTGISVKERLELRAKKFGVPLCVSAKLQARAERFGSTENNFKISEMDKLKKRAERFGGSVAKEMTNLEMEEKLEARKARFALSK